MPHKFEFNVDKPYPYCKIKVHVDMPAEARLSETIQIKLKVEYLGSEEGFFLINFEDFEENEESILVFIHKTKFLVQFDATKREEELEIEAYVLRTGFFKLPEIQISDFKSKSKIVTFK